VRVWGWTGTTTRGGLVTGGAVGVGPAPGEAGGVVTGACVAWVGVTTDAGDVERVPGKALPTYAANTPTSAAAPAASQAVARETRRSPASRWCGW
jgi:hypothetical protein